MRYVKEGHYIVAYFGEAYKGKWDIISNQFIGVKGQPVKNKPQSFAGNNTLDMDDYMKRCYDFRTFADESRPYTKERGQRIEEIISVGLSISLDWETWMTLLDDKHKFNKEYVQFIQTHFHGMYNSKCSKMYTTICDYKDFWDKCGEQRRWAENVIPYINTENIPAEFVKGMILRAIHEKVYFEYSAHSFANLMNDWYRMIIIMGDKLEVKHNILTNITILRYLYQQYKNANLNKVLKENNDLSWLYFEDETYTVFPLITREQYHEEAEYQHNCVENMYMERVAEGITHVVVVRLKNNVNTPYITCEVTNNGRIHQYLRQYNQQTHDINDLAFRQKYAEHLIHSMP